MWKHIRAAFKKHPVIMTSVAITAGFGIAKGFISLMFAVIIGVLQVTFTIGDGVIGLFYALLTHLPPQVGSDLLMQLFTHLSGK